MAQIKEGLVVTILGKGYEVEVEGEKLFCRVRGKLFHRGQKSYPVVGDRVEVEIEEHQTPTIKAILPRKSILIRRAVGKQAPQPIAANLDLVLICSAAKEPPFRPALIDRYLATCEAFQLPAVIVLNKIDLLDSETEADKLLREFQKIGYQTIKTSAREKIGIDELKELLRDKCSVLVGPSGAGKSSLINAIAPQANLEVGSLSKIGKGRHTTTVSRLIKLEDGYLVDTPGIREFGLWGIDPEKLDQYFVEFRPYLPECKFRDCKHQSEPGCAVKEAVDEGKISSRRYQSYLNLYAELTEETPY